MHMNITTIYKLHKLNIYFAQVIKMYNKLIKMCGLEDVNSMTIISRNVLRHFESISNSNYSKYRSQYFDIS